MKSRFFYNVIRKVGDDFESKCFCCDTDLHSRFSWQGAAQILTALNRTQISKEQKLLCKQIRMIQNNIRKIRKSPM